MIKTEMGTSRADAPMNAWDKMLCVLSGDRRMNSRATESLVDQSVRT